MNERRLLLGGGLAALAASLFAAREARAVPVARTIAQKDHRPVNLEGWQIAPPRSPILRASRLPAIDTPVLSSAMCWRGSTGLR